MTNSEASEEVEIILSNLETLAEGIFTRSYAPETNLKIFHAVAANMFSHKRIEKRMATIVDEEIVQLRILLEGIAIILGKTYIECADSYNLPDDEALILIRDLLLKHDGAIIARNRKKRIPEHLQW